MGSDITTESAELVSGTMHSIVVTSDDVVELRSLFTALAAGDTVVHESKEEFIETYGDLADKYGVNWMFQSDEGLKNPQDHALIRFYVPS